MDGSVEIDDRIAGASQARLREFNHRVLNSLTMISSIIGMESRALDDAAGRAALERVRSRLVAVSTLYRILSKSESDSPISAEMYLRSVAEAVSSSVGAHEKVAVEVYAAPADLTTAHAAALGLITNEAMTNAYKHAFEARNSGRIRVTLAQGTGTMTLTVLDDGCGMPESARCGLGTTLIESLAIDLGGEVSITSHAEGTCVGVCFPKVP